MKPQRKFDIPGVTPNLINRKKTYAQCTIGITPKVCISIYTLTQKPIIYFANCGHKIEGSKFQNFLQHIKNACGYRWDNGIEEIQYYDGSTYGYPFNCHVFFKEFKTGKWRFKYGIASTAYYYELTIYDPIRREKLICIKADIKSFNDRLSFENCKLIEKKIQWFEATYMSPISTKIYQDRLIK